MYTQAMNDRQMTNRVNCAQWLLQEYGYRVSGDTDWGKIVITDESANIPMHGKINSKLVKNYFNYHYFFRNIEHFETSLPEILFNVSLITSLRNFYNKFALFF